MGKYDVFISCKSEDYIYAEHIYDFLVTHGINTFLASRELRKMGESEYRRAISQAMKDAYHLIVFASKADYILSTWVYYEWDMFVNAKLKGRKQGNIITILKDVPTDDITMDLWKYESLTYESYKDTLIQYVETKESKERAELLERQKAEEEEKRQREVLRLRKIEEDKTALIRLSEEYVRDKTNLSVLASKIKSLKRAVGIACYTCPICGNKVDIDVDVCPSCGWVFHPIQSISGAEYLEDSLKHIIKMSLEARKASLSSNAKYVEIQDSISKLQAENDTLKEESEFYALEKADLEKEIKQLKADIHRKSKEITELQSTVGTLKASNTSMAQYADKNETEIQEVRADYLRLQQESEREIASLKKQIRERELQLKQERKKNASANVTNLEVEQPQGPSSILNRQYSVWATFITHECEKIIRQYDDSFSCTGVNAKNCGRTNLLIATFFSMEAAEGLKNQLESKGATVIVKDNGKPVFPKPQASSPELKSKTGKHSYQGLESSSAMFGITVKHCGINKAKVAQLLSRTYKKSSNAFKQALDKLPYDTPATLTRLGAESLVISLGQIGATAQMYQPKF